MKKIFTLAATLSMAAALQAQAPGIEWQSCIGTVNPELANSMEPTPDGGYIMAGYMYYLGNTQNTDAKVAKIDAAGSVEWEHTYGGSGGDAIFSIHPTSDGGYIMAGYTDSNNGDVIGLNGGYDYWVVKLDAAGSIQWQKCIGGSAGDGAYSILPVDGGYILTGSSLSMDGDINLPNDPNGISVFWMAKLDETGSIVWSKIIDGLGFASGLASTQDGGYIIAGQSMFDAFDPENTGGEYYVIKMDEGGITQWEKKYGGSNYECAFSIQTTLDGGYIIAGSSQSSDGDVSFNHDADDAWIVKINTTGTIEWEKSLGGFDNEHYPYIKPTPDGGYIVTAESKSNDGDVTFNHGDSDHWVVKLDATGNIEWEKSLGGDTTDVPCSIHPTPDGGYILGGTAFSANGDVEGNHGSTDFWLVKLEAPVPTVGINEVSLTPALVYPNPVKDVLNFQQQYKNVAIYGTDGKMVMQANDKENLNVSSLQAGVYFLKMETGNNKVQNVRFVKN